MPSPFDANDAAASAAVSSAFGEEAVLHPRRVSQYAGAVADPDRAAGTLTGVFSLNPAVEEFEGQRRMNRIDSMTTFAVGDAEFWIAASAAAALGYKPAAGDLLTLREAAYNVIAVHATDMGDVTLRLTAETPLP